MLHLSCCLQALLYVSVLSLVNQRSGQPQPYPTARVLGGPLRTLQEEKDDFLARLMRFSHRDEDPTVPEQRQRTAGRREHADDAVACYSLEESLDISALQLSRKLGRRVSLGRCGPLSLLRPVLRFFGTAPDDILARATVTASLTPASCCCCSFRGQPVAVKLLTSPASHLEGGREVAVYVEMTGLQGVHVPRLRAHGYTLGGKAYFVATDFLEVNAWTLSGMTLTVGRCICSPNLVRARPAPFDRVCAPMQMAPQATAQATVHLADGSAHSIFRSQCELPWQPIDHGIRVIRCWSSQGQPWDWSSPAHRALSLRLLEALQRVHDVGIRHGDLHAGNILVTPGDAVFLLGFGECELDAHHWDLEAEQRIFQQLLSLRPQVRRPLVTVSLVLPQLCEHAFENTPCDRWGVCRLSMQRCLLRKAAAVSVPEQLALRGVASSPCMYLRRMHPRSRRHEAKSLSAI